MVAKTRTWLINFNKRVEFEVLEYQELNPSSYKNALGLESGDDDYS